MDPCAKQLMTSISERLQSFKRSPLPATNRNNFSITNSPLKLAEAGFVRPNKKDLDQSDEVECSFCGIKYDDWDGESPLAVHRTLNPKCPFLNTPPATSAPLFFQRQNAFTESSNHENDLEKIRRKLFPDSETSSTSLLSICNIPDIQHPFLPKQGGYLKLFESHRLLTFNSPMAAEAAAYAEAGFIYDASSKHAICVFCDVHMDMQLENVAYLESIHQEKSPLCPFVRLFDVGNISSDAERKIREKVRARHLNESNNTKLSDVKMKCVIKHPEFEGEDARLGTFKSWPKLLALVFPAIIMAKAGFYYSGFMDKVKCYACGVGLFNWSETASPDTQHAKVSPQCVFLLQTKGKEFISQAQDEDLTVEADFEEAIQSHEQVAALSSSLSPSSTSTAAVPSETSSSSSSPSGSPVLDLEAINAAMARQYTIEQISHAVIKFFYLSNGRYPNTSLLTGILEAADELYLRLCEKSQEIQESKVKEAAYQQEIQATKTQLFAKDQEIQATKSELQRTTFELEWRDLEVRTELEQRFVGQIQQQSEIIEHKDQMIVQKNQELEQISIQLEMKNKEVEDLQRHNKSLMAVLERRGVSGSDDDEESTSSSDVEHTSESDSSPEEFPVANCKVCLIKQSQIVFLPCKHLCCCDSCASRLHGQNCPICRERNLGFEKVYVI